MDPISLALIEKALEGLSLRQEFIAQNIANANSPSYQPVRVSFEEALRGAEQNPDAIRAVTPQITQLDAGDAAEVRLDLELAEASQTAMRYRALTDLLGRQMSLERAVISSGGR